MKSPLDAQLLAELAQFRLRFCCEECAQFDPGAERCGLGYPSAPHRRAALASAESIEFCKEFELG